MLLQINVSNSKIQISTERIYEANNQHVQLLHFLFWTEFQPMTSVPNYSSLSSD